MYAAQVAFGQRHDFGLPALKLAIALIHAQQIGREQRRLVAAGAGADFHDGRGIVGRVPRQKRDAQLVIELFQPLLQLGALLLRHVADFAFGGGIGDQRFGIGNLDLGLAIGAHGLDHRRQVRHVRATA